MHLSSVHVAQLTAVFCWGVHMCFVEPCGVDCGRAQTLEFPLGLGVVAPKQGHGELLGCALQWGWPGKMFCCQ